MSSEVVVCTETCCSSTDTFLCVKHCQRYVCYDHLQEHHRSYEKEKHDLPKELRRQIQQRFSIYNRLIDQTKLDEQEKRDIEIACTEIQRTYEQRRRDHYQLQTEGTSVLESLSTIKDLKGYLEKLDVAIEREQQRERVYSNSDMPVNIKLEPNDFMDDEDFNHNEDNHENHTISNSLSNSRSLSTENKDNKSDELSAEEGERSDTNFSDINDADSDNEERQQHTTSNSDSANLKQSVTIYRGLCPLTRVGLFGILPIHNIRLCEGKSSCLYNHLQSFHHMTARSAYKVCKAVLKQRDPILTVLFGSEDILYNKHFHIACPFNEDAKNPFECQPKYIYKAPCSSIISRLDMPRHLRDVHHVYRTSALKIVAEMRRCSKNSDKNQILKLNPTLFDKHENIIEVIDEKSNTRMKRISLLSDISNDLFFEIFDYLDVFDIFHGFYNLNQYFNYLIINRHICFQANMLSLKPNEYSIYKNIILPKISCYIRYLSISDELNYLQIILRSFSLVNLQSIRLYNVKLNELKILLQYCKLKSILIDTNSIQNEKHLNEIFKILFNQQLDLRSIQCNFYTKLHFIEEQYKISKVRKVIIDCECFSSDLIVLISQLPELYHLSAYINDHNRECMDKDIDHISESKSLRSLILHIENIDLNRLLLIFSLTINVHILELNGTIDFDINHLFKLQRKYTSFRYMKYKFLFLIACYIIGLLFFLNGFLLTRRVIIQNSVGSIPSSIPTEFNQVILIVIDALRYDFIKPNDNLINSTYLNQMPFIKELLERKSKQSVLFKLIADPPTTTLQRLKALTTGTLPTFIDVSYNFIGYEIGEDNILNQLKENSYQRNISLLGDDTWLALYPNIPFKHLHVYPSFDVHDLDTVDNGILKHLWTVIDDTQHHQQLSFIIAHFLGVDHCGHRYGPLHIEMKRKLNQMDEVIRNITLSIDKSNISSLLMIIGDHGMTQQGDHGGDELNEIETAMFLYTNKPNYFSLSNNKQYTVSQIDLVPTLSWFLHTLIPFSNIGMMIIDIIPKEQRYLAMKLNFEQMEIYLKHISLTLQLSDKIHELRASLHTIFITFDRERNLTQIENLFNEFKFELQTHFRRQWSTFNIFRIILGLIIMLLSCIILLFIYFEFSKKSIDYKNIIFTISLTLIYFAISFSNSFIINEAICLYFLIQTIILITKMNIFKKFLLSFLLFLTRIFLICREEQQPYCIDPLWLLSKSSDTSHYFLPFMASIAWFIILILSSNYSYISYIIIVAYWFNISHTLSIFYLSVIIQFCFVLFKPSHIDTLIYSILIFVVGYRFSFVIFLQYFIYYIIFKNNKNNQSLPLLLSLLADYFFYATGHQPVLSQIRWTAAFPTINTPLHIYLSSIINSLFVRGVFILIETFSGQILNIILIRKMIPKKYQGNLLKHILIVDCFKLLMTSLSVFILRRHLMLWKIFSPRFLFQLVGFIIKCLFVFLTMKLQK
ncbi:unnamed protein product [Adineta steineri]|uniref:GPI ethanolamine phosphate transferase 3 n=1 Tax=Adineta steineri TaxID=433720 RepID=A0A818GSE4_9BILA|nr:unnamed protein product [Adineta steineri]CAF3496855.1 unnamed protein product [Adineta steineri]